MATNNNNEPGCGDPHRLRSKNMTDAARACVRDTVWKTDGRRPSSCFSTQKERISANAARPCTDKASRLRLLANETLSRTAPRRSGPSVQKVHGNSLFVHSWLAATRSCCCCCCSCCFSPLQDALKVLPLRPGVDSVG